MDWNVFISKEFTNKRHAIVSYSRPGWKISIFKSITPARFPPHLECLMYISCVLRT